MSTLSKVFVVLLLVVSLVYLGISATLFEQRIDLMKKYELERGRHADTIKQRDLVIAHYKADIEQSKREILVREDEVRRLNQELRDNQERLTRAMTDIDDLKTQLQQLNVRLGEAIDHLKAATRYAEELRKKLEETTSDANAARAERDQALYEMQTAKRQLDIANKDLGDLERQHVELAKELDKLKLMIDEMVKAGIDVTAIAAHDVPKNIKGHVMAVSDQFNVAVLSVGADDGVKMGYPFTISRGDKFVAKATVDSVERDWCTVHWEPTMAKGPVMINDDAATSVTIGPTAVPREKSGNK